MKKHGSQATAPSSSSSAMIMSSLGAKTSVSKSSVKDF